MKYDPDVLNKYANRLYNRSLFLIVLYALVGLFGGYIAGAIAGTSSALADLLGKSTSEVRLALLALGAIFGGAIGDAKAFRMRLQAQTIMCLKQIEENTRNHS